MKQPDARTMDTHHKINSEKSPVGTVTARRKCFGETCKRKRNVMRSVTQFEGDSQLCIICAKREKQIDEVGYFVDWNGEVRSIFSPGDGYRCETDNHCVDVIAEDGEIIYEADYHPSIESIKACGVDVVMAKREK